jgi:adenine-specific DNA-methyltransferase
MLNYIIEQTDKYIIANSKDDRKSSGQFFTSKETAQFMAGMFSIPDKETVKILDPGSGTGILSAALVERLQKYGPTLKKIELTCFEPNESVHDVLSSNLDFLKSNSRIELSTTIIAENYLLSQQYDYNRTFFLKILCQNTI